MARAPVERYAFQYAAKFICGVDREHELLAPGTYETAINVHNPHRDSQSYRFKLALAKSGGDGQIYSFNSTTIKPDGAHHFACRAVRKIYGIDPSILLDGFFVIECKRSLDVIAVYTTNDARGSGVPAIDVERVFERKL